jgi:HEAT repeat protein
MHLVLLSGGVAGAALALCLVAVARTEPPIALVHGFLLLAAAGVAAGGLEIAFALLARALSRIPPLRGRPTIALAIAASIPIAMICFLVVNTMFSGRSARDLPGRDLVVVLLTGAMAACASAVLLLGRGFARRLSVSGAEGRRVPAAMLAVGMAILLLLDRIVLVRRYEALHLALAGAAFLAGQAAAAVLIHRPVSRWPRLATSAWLLLAAGGIVSLAQLQRPERADVRRVLASTGAAGTRLLDGALALRKLEPPVSAVPELVPRALAGDGAAAGPARFPGADVVIITVDALRADHLGFHGYRRATSPALDQFAARAVVFEQAYAPTPHTSFSLASLITGRQTWSLGRARRLDGLRTLADAYREAGYRTAGLFPPAVFFVERELFADQERRRLGFEHAPMSAYEEGRDATARTDEAIARLEASAGQRVFLWVHYFGPHEPYLHYPDAGAPAFGGRDVDRYDEEILRVDRELERLLRYLAVRRPGAIVVVTADHGEEFGEHGGSYHGTSLFDEQLRVPLVLAVPGAPSRRVTTPVSTVDVAPTLAELTGIAWPASGDGIPLTGVVMGGDAQPRAVFAELDGLKMLRQGRHKLLCDVTRDFCRLYDLAADPGERKDIAPRAPGLTGEMRRALLAWLQRASATGPDRGPTGTAVEELLERAARFETGAAVELGAVLQRRAEPDAPDDRQRGRAAELLARLPYPGKAAALQGLLDGDPDERVRGWAAIGLALEGRSEVADRIDAIEVPKGDRVKLAYRALALAALGRPRAADELISVLPGIEDVTVRCRMVKALAATGHGSALQALRQAYEVVRSRICVAQALAELRSPDSLPFVRARLADEPYSNVRAALAKAIARIDGERAIPVLRALFRTETEEVVVSATARSLVGLGAALPVVRRRPLAVPPEARELWLVPASLPGASLRIGLRDRAGRRSASRIDTEAGRDVYALVLPGRSSRFRPTRAFVPRGYALFR